MLLVFGELDENIRKIEKVTGAMIRQTQEGVEITGDAESTAMASDTINNLLKLIRNGELVDENTVGIAGGEVLVIQDPDLHVQLLADTLHPLA